MNEAEKKFFESIVTDVKRIAEAGMEMSQGCVLMNEMLGINMRLTCYLLLKSLGTLDIETVVKEVNSIDVDAAAVDAIYRGMGISPSKEVH